MRRGFTPAGALFAAAVSLAALLGVPVPAAAQSDTAESAALSFGSATVESRLYDTGTAITPIVLPQATGGTGAVSYTLAPATLPRGLTWTASTRTIAGTPSAVTAATTYTWTATDAGGVAVALTFSLRVWAPAGPAVNGVDVWEWTVNGVTKSNYQSGETIKLMLQYPEKVAVTGTPQLALDVGGRTRTAGYDAAETAELRQGWAADTADVLVFTYTVRADDFDGDGAAVPADALRLNGGTIRTVAAGTDVKLSLGSHAVASGGTVSAKMRVRDTAPAFSQAASAADRSLARGVATSTTLPRATDGDGAITYTISPALPRGLALGSASATITGTPMASGATTHTLTATDADGDRTALGPFTITVAAANAPKPSNLTILPNDGSGAASFDGDYAAGEVIWAIVTFDRAVTVTGAPQLALTIGAHTRQAAFSRTSSDPDDISFKYTVTAADFDGDGIGIGSAALTLNGGGIADAGDASVAAARDLSVYDFTNDDRYTVRDTQPTFGAASVGNKTYPTGTAVNDSLPAATGGDGTVRYSLAPALPAGLAFDAGRRRIHGTPTAQAASTTYTYRATDGDGDAATLTFRLAATSVPTVSAVTIRSSPASGGAYGVQETISVDVRFDQAVTVTTPNPSLELTVGSNARSAAFASKLDASTLRFSYRVQASDDDDDGIGVAAGALTLTGAGKLRDATGTRNANLALGSHAIAAASGHKVDTPPVISGAAITSSPTGGNYAAGDVISVRLTFTESVFVRSDAPTVALTIGADTRTATWHSGTSAPPSHTFTYTVQASDFDGDGISIAAGAVTANGGFLTYSGSDDPFRRALVGLGSHAVTNDADHRVRDTAPAFSAAVAAQHYVAGTAASLTLPTATGDGSISYELTSTLPGGLAYSSAGRTISGTPQAAGAASEQTWVATDGDGDETTLTFTITVASAAAPKVSALSFRSSPRSGDTYGAGETIAVGLKFDKTVTKTGTPRLALSIGSRTRYADYYASPSSLTGYHHVFSYTVQGADRDADGIGIGASALELNGGSIVQSSDTGVAASLGLGSHAVAAAGSHKVDGGANAAPAVRAVGIQSRPVASSGYAAGDVIRLSVGFTEELAVTGSPRLAIQIGSVKRQATFDRAELKSLHFRYTVLVSDDDADGISVAADALTLPAGATVQDAHGANAALGLGSYALGHQTEHKVHTPPRVTGLAIVSTPQQANTYTRGGTIKVRVSFDQAVTVAGSPRLSLTIGGQTRAATAAAGSGNAYVDFSYTVAAGDTDADGLGITGGALTLPSGATIRDAGATDAVLDLSRYAATRYASAKVDGSRTGLWPDFGVASGPDLSMLTNRVVNYSLHPSCGPLHVGCALPSSATGDAPLAYTVSPALPAGLTLNRATAILTGAATVAAPSTRHTLTVTDANGDTDTVTFTLAVVGARPTVRDVSFLSSPAADSTYARNEEIRVAVRFRRQGAAALVVTGAPRLALQVGGVTRQAAYYGVSGDEVRFRYTVQAADRDADGVSIAAGALTLNGGAIRDAAGNAAVLGLGRHTVSSQAAHKVDGGVTRAPSVAGVTITSRPAAGDTYSRGEAVEVAVRFSQGVGVTGSPRLALRIGSATRQAGYDRAGATSATQYFRYVVQQADVDADGLSIGSGALTLNSGAIRSNAGANAALGLGSHAITNAGAAKVNGALNSPAIVTGVAVTSRPATGDTFRIGEEIRVRVTFSKAVVAARRTYRQGNPGWPRLALTVGSHTRHAALKVSTQYTERAPASTTLEFGYTVPAGDYDGDGFGIAQGALDVNLGSVSRGGVNATLGLGSHAVSAAAYKVDGRRASVSGVSITSRPSADNTYAAGEVIRVALTFNQPIRVTARAPNLPTLGLLVGANTRQMAYAGAGANSIAFSYTVQAADRDADGVSVVSSGLSLNGAVIETAANGNPAVTDISRFTVRGGASHKVDGAIRPPVVRSLVIGAPQRGSTFDRYEVIGINVKFSQDVTVTGTPRLSLVIGSSTKTLDLASASGSQLRFEYEVQAGDVDGNGVDVPANSLTLNGGTIRNRYGVNAALGHGSIRTYVTNASTPNVDGAANHPPVVVSAGFVGLPAGGVYGKGDAIDVVVNWGKRVTVTGTPQLAIDVGSGTRQAGRHSGSQRYTRFRYVVLAGDRDSDGIGFGSGALTLNGATITGPGGTTASLTLPAVAADANRRVDGRVLPQPAFTGSVSARTWAVGASVSEALPAAAGARGTLSYALRPALPDGLQFSAASRTISGTPTTVTALATYTLEATDSVTGAKGTLDFTIEITPNAAPVFVPDTFAAQVYVKDETISPVALPAASSGTGALSYALTGPGAATTLTLPAGVSYTAPTGANTGGTLSGTPTAVAAQATYTLTATDADDDQATLTFTLEVQDDAAPDFGAASVADQSWRRYKALTAFTLPAATGGNGTLTYTLSPALPAGAAKDASHRISGTPSVALEATTYTWTATDRDGDRAELTFTITVADNSLPAFTGLAPMSYAWTRYKSVSGILPVAIGGDAPLSYALAPVLPAGVARSASPRAGSEPEEPVVDTHNRTLAGRPSAAMARTAYAWTATDADGDQAVWSFTITVRDNGRPGFGAATIPDQSWTRRKEITAFTLPAATGGDGSVSYTLSPALPSGVTKDASHRISGTPAAALAQTEYTWTATDGDGDTASLTFDVTVADRPQATLVLTPSTIGESGTGNVATVTATLDKEASTATTVTVSAAAGTNAEAGDFTLSANKTLTIAAGDTTSTGAVTITAVDNADAELDKSVTVSGSVGSEDVAAPDDVTLTITDDDRPSTPTLYIDSPSVTEGGPGDSNTLEWTVTLIPASTQRVSVSVAVNSTGTATLGTLRTRAQTGADHGFPPEPTLVFAAGVTTQTVPVSVYGDATPEPDETVVMELSNPSNASLGNATGTGTILDDDAPAVTLAVADSAIAENGGTTTVTATLSQAASAATTVTVTAVAGAYTVGSDATITIAAGETANATDSVTITAVDDAIDNVGDRSVTVTGTATASGRVTGAALTLTDDEDTPVATLALSSATIDEHDGTNPGSATVTATLNRASTEAVTLTVAAAAGTNAAVTDFNLSSANTLTIAAGETSSTGTVTVTAVDNTADAPDKQVTVSATVSGDSGVADPTSVTLTIDDDEAAPTVTLALADASISENGGTTTVTATLSHASSAATTVTVAGVAGAYTVDSSDATITIPAGETSNTADSVTITAVNDAVDNVGDRAVTVTGTAANAQAAAESQTVAVTGAALTLTDDEATPEATLVLSPATIDESDGTNPGSATVTATLNRASSEAVTLTVAAAAGTNAASGDFRLSSAKTLTIAAGDTSSTGTVTVAAADNAKDEPDKSVTVTATVSGGSGVSNPSAVTLTIEDDDTAPSVSISSPGVTEGASGSTATLSFEVTLSAESGKEVTVAYAEGTGGTAGTATAGTDYTALSSGTLTFAAGETSKTVSVTVTGDGVDEPNETVKVVLSGATNASIATATGTGTIRDDDAAPTVTLVLSSSSISENGGEATVSATLSHASSEATTVTVTASAGAHTAATDFTQTGTTLTVAAGATVSTGTVTVAAVDDTEDAEHDKTVAVSATAGNGQGVAGNPSPVALTIEDDDVDLKPTFGSEEVADQSWPVSTEIARLTLPAATGGDGVLSYTLSPSLPSGLGRSGFIVTGTTPSESVVSADYTWTVRDEDGDEASLPFAIEVVESDIRSPGAAPSLSVSSPEVAEGATGETATLRYEVVLSAESTEEVEVSYADAGTGTATSGTDYTALASGTLTFAAGETSKTVDVTVTGDATDEPDETVAVVLSGPVNAQVPVSGRTGTGTIEDDDEAPGVTLALSSTSVSENGGTTSVSATLSHPSSEATTVTVTGVSGSYTAGSDAVIVIAAGNTANAADTATIAAVDDAIDNVVNRTVTVTGTASNGQAAADSETVAVTGAALTLTDDEATPTVTLALSEPDPSKPDTIDEGGAGNASTVTASLSGKSSEAVTLTVTATAGTNAVSGDFTQTGTTLTIAAGSTASTGAVTVAAADNAKDEPDKSVTVTATVSGASGVANPSAVTLTIEDDDAAPSVSISSPGVTEGASGSTATLSFEVTLSAESGREVTVAYAEGTGGTAGTATAGTDYTALSGGTLTFAAGETGKTVAVSVTGDATDEPDETVKVVLSGAVNATLGTATGTGTIRDDDDPPELSIDSPSVAEGDSGSTNLTYTVSLDAESDKEITVAYAEGTGGTAGTATAGTDYTALASGTLTFAAGETSKTITVSVTGDTTDEPDETVVVTLSGAANASIGTGTGTGTITDDDGEPSLSIDSPSVAEGDSGSTNLTFTVALSPASGQQVTVGYADAGTGTATAGAVGARGTDYTALASGTLTFVAGETSKTVTVSVTGDTLDEPNETVVVTLSGAANASIGTATGTGTITDDDAAPSLSIDSPSVAEGDSGSTDLTYTVALSPASGKQVTVGYAEGTGGTATAGAVGARGTDYTALASGTLTFAAGETSKTITVSVTGDTTDEPDETVVVKLSGAANASIGTATGTGTITDDDGEPSLSIDSPSVAEGDSGSTNLTYTVSLGAESGKQVTVGYAEGTGGTAKAGAVGARGTDYTALASGTLTFAAGETSKTVTVSVTGDTTDEPDETVVVTLSGVTNASISTAAGTGTITDDDDPPELSIDSPSVSEGDSGSTNLTYTVSLDAESGKQVTVGYAEGTGGTATAGTDYTALAGGTLTFAAGETSKTVTVTVTGDTLDEPNETVAVKLSGATNASISTARGTGTITDDDGEPSLSIDSPSVAEGDSGSVNLTYTVSLGAESGKQVTVGYADAGTGTATSGTDYTALASGTLTFAAGETSKTVTVSVTGDTTDEPNETVAVTLSGAANASIGTGTGTGTITDDDGEPSLSIDSPSVAEGDSGSVNLTYTVSLGAESGKQVTVGYAEGTGGTATAGTDYTALAGGTLTFAAGETSKTITVSVTGDTTDEPNETVVVTLSGATNASIGTATGTGTITDDDGEPSLSIDSPSVAEGDSGSVNLTYTVSLGAESGKQVTVGYAEGTGGTATAGTDYTALASGTLTFAAGETSKTVTVTVIGDTLDEPNEMVAVTLSGATNASIATATGTGTITDDDGEPSLSIDSPSVAEGDSGSVNLTYTVSLDAESGKQVTVGYADAGTGTATSGTDYTALSSGTLTFAAGDTSKIITVSVTGDTTDEPDETVAVKLSGAANASIATATGTGTITDDDGAPSVTLALSSTSIPENGGTTSVSATLSHPSSDSTTVTVTAVSGFYTAGSDAVIVIAAGSTSNATDTATITAVDDAIDNVVNRTVTVTGTASNGQAAADSETVAVTGATLTLTDDEGAPTATLVLTPSSVSENGGEATVSATLSHASSATVTLTVTAAAGANAADGDFTLSSPATLTIAAGSTASTGTVTVAANDNSTDEPDKSVTVTATVSGGHGVAAPSAVTLTITDDDGTSVVGDPATGLIAHAGAPQTVNEGEEVTLDGSGSSASGQGVELSYAWRQSGGSPQVVLTDAGAAGPKFTAPEVAGTMALTFELTVSAGGASASAATTVTVTDRAAGEADSAPSFGDVAVAEQFWTQNTAIEEFTLPAATGGAGTLAYTLSPALPAGVSRDAGRRVSGTPSEPRARTKYTWTATDGGDNTATLDFHVTVAAEPVAALAVEDLFPEFTETAPAQRYWVGTAIAALELPAATGGDGPLAYALSPALPEGLGFDEATRTVSGTPSVAMAETEYTLTATDADGDEAALRFTVEVWTPITLTMADAEAMEGEEVAFVLELSPAPRRPMMVACITSPVTATANGDYEHATDHRFSIAAGAGSVRVAIPTIDDEEVEPDETFTVNIVPEWREVKGVEATGTIIDDDVSRRGRALEAVLASFGRTMASEAVNAIEDRFSGVSSSESHVTLGGRRLPLDGLGGGGAWEMGVGSAGGEAFGVESGVMEGGVGGSSVFGGGEGPLPDGGSGAGESLTAREMVSGSSFALRFGVPEEAGSGADAAGGWTVWGRTGRSEFSGRPEIGLTAEGDVSSGYVGMDTRLRSDLLAGVALSYNEGAMSYELEGERGKVEATLTGVLPYGRWAMDEGVSVWGLAGMGWGDAELVDGVGATRTEIGMRLLALGWRKELGDGEGVEWALKGDGFVVGMESEAASMLPGTKSDVQRMRMMWETGKEWPVGDHGRLRLDLEFGGRWDGGRVEKGYGTEVGGGLEYADGRMGLEVEARGRYLLAHRSEGMMERGVSVAVRFDPGGDGEGVWMGLAPRWGASGSGVESLWGRVPERGGGEGARGAMGLELGYRRVEPFEMGVTVGMERGEGASAPTFGVTFQGRIRW